MHADVITIPNHLSVLIDLVLRDAAAAPQVVLFVSVVRTALRSVRLGASDYFIKSCSPRAQCRDFRFYFEAAASVEFGVGEVLHLVNEEAHNYGWVFRVPKSYFLTN